MYLYIDGDCIASDMDQSEVPTEISSQDDKELRRRTSSRTIIVDPATVTVNAPTQSNPTCMLLILLIFDMN